MRSKQPNHMNNLKPPSQNLKLHLKSKLQVQARLGRKKEKTMSQNQWETAKAYWKENSAPNTYISEKEKEKQG